MKTLREYINVISEADYPMGARPGSGQITQQNLNPDEYAAKMNYVNQMRQQQGQAPIDVTPSNQIATPTNTAPQVVYDQGQQGQGATPAPAAPVVQKDPKVLALQQKLNALGAGLAPDSIMGPKTQAAMKQYGLDINGNTTAPTVAAQGQPPATLAKNTPVGQAQTNAAAMAIKKGQENPNSGYANVQIAQPTGAIAPTAINQGSGVGKSSTLSPDELKAAQDAINDPTISARDKAAYQTMISNTTQTPTARPQAYRGTTARTVRENTDLVAMLTIAGLR